MKLRERYIKYKFPKVQDMKKPDYDIVAYHRDIVYFNRKQKREQRRIVFALWFAYQQLLWNKWVAKMVKKFKRKKK